jgi:monoamine oxidase
MIDVAILGAGVSGLTAAWRLRAAGLDVEVFEARDRLGGRAVTQDGFDLGATWVWDTETHVHALLDELGVATFRPDTPGLDTYDDGTVQRGQLPQSAVPERRLVGGLTSLVDALAAKAGPVHLGTAVHHLTPGDDHVLVHLADREVRARRVVAALPPSLVAPWIPGDEGKLLTHVPVWMGTIAKCIGIFERPVWRDAGWSGRAFSRVGPMTEVHDLSSDAGPALFGFVPQTNGHDLEQRVPAQFERLFGVRPARLLLQRWWDEPYTTLGGPEDQRLFGHPFLRRPLLDGRLHLVSCETSGVSPGHLSGAVERAEAVSALLRANGSEVRC